MPTVHGHAHKEAYCRMLYRCSQRETTKPYRGETGNATRAERRPCTWEGSVWNSRDGVTPFGIRCPGCGGEALHVAWHRDLYAPDYRLKPGDLFFRDGTPDEARAIMRRRLESAIGTRYEIPRAAWDTYIEHAASPDTGLRPVGEFSPGWPTIEVA